MGQIGIELHGYDELACLMFRQPLCIRTVCGGFARNRLRKAFAYLLMQYRRNMFEQIKIFLLIQSLLVAVLVPAWA